jgi:N-acyl homoserine lactone hydrolase
MEKECSTRWTRRQFTAAAGGLLAVGGLGGESRGQSSLESTSRPAERARGKASPGKPVYRIHPLRNGDVGIPGKYAFKGGSENEVHPYRLYAFLILGGAKPMLVDAGLIDVDDMNRGAAHVLASPIVQKPEHTIPNHLRRLGLAPEDVGHVFITHLHFDHVDGLDAFTNAAVYIGRKEWEHAKRAHEEGRGWAHGRLMHNFLSEPQWKRRLNLVEDQEILPGVESFLVGGHTPGSMAYSFNTAAGRTVCTGDTVSLLANLEKNIPIGVYHDLDECVSGMQKVRERADFVLPSHDPLNDERRPPRMADKP